jgi:AcrR family transcriptional regulator
VARDVRQGKGRLVREKVLDAAERLLRADPGATFSMRELAAEAGVSFATPFNQYGSKAAIAQALSARRIGQMVGRLEDADPPGDAVERALAAVRVATALLLEEPQVNRAMMGVLGSGSGTPSAVGAQSGALWAAALGGFDGIEPSVAAAARAWLPGQLALVFRGCLSFWVGREIADHDLPAAAERAAAITLACFVEPARRAALLAEEWSAPPLAASADDHTSA